MPTPPGSTPGKIEWKDVPPESYVDMSSGYPEDRLPTAVDNIPKTLYAAAILAFCLGGGMEGLTKEFHWFRYLATAGVGAAVAFYLAARMAQSAIFFQSDREREKRGLKKSVRPIPAWKKCLRSKGPGAQAKP